MKMFRRTLERAFGPALLLGAATVALTAPMPAVAQADPVATAAALQSQGRAEEAYRLLKPLEGERAGDAAFDYALGVAAADTRRFGEALIALQRVLAVQPGNAPARAELARVYA